MVVFLLYPSFCFFDALEVSLWEYIPKWNQEDDVTSLSQFAKNETDNTLTQLHPIACNGLPNSAWTIFLNRGFHFLINFVAVLFSWGTGILYFVEIGEFTVPLTFSFYTVYLPVGAQPGSWYVFCSSTCLYNI